MAKEKSNEVRKKVKLATSFDSQYWMARRDAASYDLEAVRLNRKISVVKLNTSTDEFLRSPEGVKLMLREKASEMDVSIYAAQADRMSDDSPDFILRKSFVGLFIGAKSGWDIKNNPGRRDKNTQETYKNDLIKVFGSRHENPLKEEYWCPITGQYWPRSSIRAAHFFPRRAGEDTMNIIFGKTKNEDGISELNKAENRIIWSQEAEERFINGSFTLVPDIRDNAEAEEIERWEKLEIKEYKIRVLNREDPSMQTEIFATDKKWLELDNQRVKFRTDFRPRARYLYFAYCEAMLRRCFTRGKDKEVSKEELGRRSWGTPGRYMLRGMLLGFVEQLGHNYDHLLEGASNEDEEVRIEGIQAANDHVKETLGVTQEDEEEEAEEEERIDI